MNERIEIPTSKAKAILLLLGSIVFVAIGFWFLFDSSMVLFVKIIGVVSILFFGLGFVAFHKMFFNKLPGLIIDEYGITDNVTKPPVGVIEWKDIVEIEIIQIATTNMLAIYVENPEKYLCNITAQGLWNNYKMIGTPFVIPSSILTMKLVKLEALLNSKLDEYRTQLIP